MLERTGPHHGDRISCHRGPDRSRSASSARSCEMRGRARRDSSARKRFVRSVIASTTYRVVTSPQPETCRPPPRVAWFGRTVCRRPSACVLPVRPPCASPARGRAADSPAARPAATPRTERSPPAASAVSFKPGISGTRIQMLAVDSGPAPCRFSRIAAFETARVPPVRVRRPSAFRSYRNRSTTGATASRSSGGAKPQVSTAVCRPARRQASQQLAGSPAASAARRPRT